MKIQGSSFRQIKWLAIGFLLLNSMACAIRPPVTSDYDVNYDFSLLKTYQWVKAKDPGFVQTLDSKRQANAIETILNRKGYRKAAAGESADFLLKTHTLTDRQTNVDTFYRNWGYYPSPYFWGWPNNSSTIVREYKVGTIILDIVDPKAHQVIWRGSIARKLGIYRNVTPEERSTIALANAEWLLQSFPQAQ